MKKELRSRTALMKTKSSRAGAMFVNEKAPEAKLRHFYNGSASLTYAPWR